MFIIEPASFRHLGSISYRGWDIRAYKRPGGFSLYAIRDHTSKDTLSRESLSEAWRVLKPHLAPQE